MEKDDSHISYAGEAGLRKVAALVSCPAEWEDMLSLGSRDCLQTPTPEAIGGAKKVIAQKVSGSVKWYNVKHGYGFIRRHDTKEEVFVLHSAISQSSPCRCNRGLGAGEAVEFDVVQGKRGNEAANVTGPAGVPVKGSRIRPRFRNRHIKLQPRHDAGDAEEDNDSDYGREGFPAAQGQNHPAPAVSTPPRLGHGLSYRLSRPRSRGTATGPKPSPDLTQELEEAEKKESRIDAIGLHQGSWPHYICHFPNNPCDCHRLQQLPGKQGQKPEGGEDKIGKGPAGKPACVAEKTSTSEEETTVAKASSAAQAQ